MIYTVGAVEVYGPILRRGSEFLKSGRDLSRQYPGGTVWRSREEAQACCPDGYAVYGVLADWESDTVAPQDGGSGGSRDLLIDARVVTADWEGAG